MTEETLPLQNEQQKQQMLDVLDEYFTRGVDKKKFINTDRIPLICQDIAVIHNKMETMENSMNKIQDNVTWLVRLVVGAVVLALLGLVLVK